MAAAGLADVLTGDVRPVVGLRLEHHLLDQPAVLLLHVSAVGQSPAGVRGALREIVAQLLELGQREQSRTTPAGYIPVEVLARPGGAEQPRELRLQPGDLVEERPSGGALVRERGSERADSSVETPGTTAASLAPLPRALWHPQRRATAPRVSTSAASQSASSDAMRGTPLTCRAHRCIRRQAGR